MDHSRSTASANPKEESHLYEIYNRHVKHTQDQWREDLRYESLKTAGIGNIFIKNLDAKVTENDLSDIFSPYGTIVRLKVARDEEGKSKGYGFVNFETDETANVAIRDMDGKLLYNKKLIVTHFIRYKNRPKKEDQKKEGKK